MTEYWRSNPSREFFADRGQRPTYNEPRDRNIRSQTSKPGVQKSKTPPNPLPKPPPQMHQSLMQKIWESRSFADISLTCCDGVVQAHRCVISASSPVFEAMLTGNMQEAWSEKVEIVDCSASTVEAALCLIYTGQVSGDIDFPSLLRFAHKYGMEELIKFSAEMLAHDVNAENVADALVCLRQLTDHKEVNSVFQRVLRKIQQDISLTEAMARQL